MNKNKLTEHNLAEIFTGSSVRATTRENNKMLLL
jgi:hypothetical protein